MKKTLMITFFMTLAATNLIVTSNQPTEEQQQRLIKALNARDATAITKLFTEGNITPNFTFDYRLMPRLYLHLKN